MRTAAITPDVFMSTPGSVMVMYKGVNTGFHTILQGSDRGDNLSTSQGYDNMRCITSGFVINESSNFQFLTTLRNFTYLYTFGDKISEIDVNGVAFLNGDCDGKSGVQAIYDFFARNKVSNTLKPVSFTMVSFSPNFNRARSFKAFLTSFNVGISDAGSMLANFSLKMYYMPGVN